MKVSAGEAAKMVGKSIPTITRAIKNGKLTANKLDGGGYQIEVSELTRVFDAVTPESNSETHTLGRETGSETRVLEVKLEASEAMNQRLLDELADMKEQREKWEREAGHWHDQATRLLLERPQEPAAPAPQPVADPPPEPSQPAAHDRGSFLARAAWVLTGGKLKS